MTALRTSLAALPSTPTETDVMRRRRELEPKLYRKHGAIIIRRDDPDLTGMHRLMFDVLAKTRFGA